MLVSAETRLRLRRYHAARADAKRALAANPNNPAAWHSLGIALSGLKRHKEAVACYDKALALMPENGTFWQHRSAAIHASKRKTATSDINEEPTTDPQDADGWALRGGFLLAAQRFAEAAAASDRALAINPNHLGAARIGIRSRISTCDWRQREDDEQRIAEGLRAASRSSGRSIIERYPSPKRRISSSRSFGRRPFRAQSRYGAAKAMPMNVSGSLISAQNSTITRLRS